MAGVAQRNKLPGAYFSFGDPQNKISAKFGVSKKQLIAAEFAYKRIVVDLD
jgi:hypothetical protein